MRYSHRWEKEDRMRTRSHHIHRFMAPGDVRQPPATAGGQPLWSFLGFSAFGQLTPRPSPPYAVSVRQVQVLLSSFLPTLALAQLPSASGSSDQRPQETPTP